MIQVEIISDKLVKLTSSLKTGKVQEIISGRIHNEVICNKDAQGNFQEIKIRTSKK